MRLLRWLIHNENNEDNIAISPYGAVSILVALGEGLQGEASYFIPKEGFLAGLTLNHENVTLRPSYVDTLKYYGFDITSFNSGLYPPPPTTERPSLTTSDTPGREMTMEMTLPTSTTERQSKLDTTVVTASVTVEGTVTTAQPTTTSQETTTTITTTIPMTLTEISTILPTERTTTITTLQPTTIPNSDTTTLKIITTEVPTTNTTFVTTEVSMSTTEELTKTTREIKDGSITPSVITEEIYTTLSTSPTSTTQETTTITSINIDTTTKMSTEPVETTVEEITTTEINTENVPMEISSTIEYTTQAPTTVITSIITTTESAIPETTSKLPDTTIITTTEPTKTETETTTESIMLETTLVTLPSEISTELESFSQPTPLEVSKEVESFPQTTTTEISKEVELFPKTTIKETTDGLIEEPTTEPSFSKETSTEVSNVAETSTQAKTTATIIESVTFESTFVPTSTMAETFTQTEVTETTTETPAREVQTEILTDNEAVDSSTEIVTETEAVPETTTLLSYPYPDASTPEIETSKEVNENEVFTSDAPALTAKRKRSKNNFMRLNIYKHRPRSTYTSDYNEYISGKHRKLVSGVEDSKRDLVRKTRSVVDYVIARYYDDYHSNNHQYLEPYVPQTRPSFLIQGKYRENQIEFMKYDTVLPFFYVSHLKALALSFPLDSPKYYLLILLPVQENGVDRLICELRLNGSLKYIIDNLRLRHVTAVIPSFMLKGYVNLTPTLQKLGIRRVFEPNQADFSPMTSFREIFVTNIEQAITVNIRNYVEPDPIVNRREFRQDPPVDFRVDRPFLYFVVDTELHVTLMAGKIVNPLNTRIT
ncbi:unnamed protein product [Diabrotica balteata]|uniref:Serpin domain-containing protein n=1 Tax=Diabrotica balteata TaxID=107213 RepID=A0A9N9SLW9_DIABA|nr:unnamed protein product [Diabrotica balteata]